MGAKIFSFVNFKGGVGKTASVINVGACLAKYHAKRVLAVDLDPQCNASLWLMRPDHWRQHTGTGRHSTYQIFHDAGLESPQFDFEKAVARGLPRREFPLIPNLDLLPASVQLLRIEDSIHHIKGGQHYKLLDKAMAAWRDQYDYILLDCPPNLYAVTKNALFASDYCVVPFLPDYLSLSGFQVLVEQIGEFYSKVAGALAGRETPSVAAVIVSHYNKVGHVFSIGVSELEKQLDLCRSAGAVNPQAAILHPYIRHNVSVAESTSEHLPVILHQPGSIGAQDYADLTQNFLSHFEKLP